MFTFVPSLCDVGDNWRYINIILIRDMQLLLHSFIYTNRPATFVSRSAMGMSLIDTEKEKITEPFFN